MILIEKVTMEYTSKVHCEAKADIKLDDAETIESSVVNIAVVGKSFNFNNLRFYDYQHKVASPRLKGYRAAI